MKYALLLFEDSAATPLTAEDEAALMPEYLAIGGAPGVFGGEELAPVATATTVRVADGTVLTTDGPFAETKEVFGGFYLLEADDLDAAIALAAKVPCARMGGSVEIRPLMVRP